MIRWLYTNTVSKGVSKHVWSPKTTDVHFANAWVQAVLENPDKNIFIKTLGLQKLEDYPEAFEAMKTFDIIYTHLISISDIGKYRWNQFPRVIKETLGKDCPKIMMSIDDEPNHVPPHPDNIDAMNHADLIASVSKNCLEQWSRYTNTPIRYIPSPKYYQMVRNPTPIKDREKKVAIMNHTGVPLSHGGHVGIRTQLEVCKKLGCKVVIFTGWFNQSPQTLIRIANSVGVPEKNVEAYTRLGRVEYFEKLAECWVGLEDEYIGASRFAAECASLKIPIVGTAYVTGARVANPDLVTPPRDVDRKTNIIQRLFEDDTFYKQQAEVAYTNLLHHYDPAVCLDRLLEAWKEIGVT